MQAFASFCGSLTPSRAIPKVRSLIRPNFAPFAHYTADVIETRTVEKTEGRKMRKSRKGRIWKFYKFSGRDQSSTSDFRLRPS